VAWLGCSALSSARKEDGMSKTDHARKPRRHSFYWRMRPRRTPRPQVPKRVAIAEQIAAMLDDLLVGPANLAVPECMYDPSDLTFESQGYHEERHGDEYDEYYDSPFPLAVEDRQPVMFADDLLPFCEPEPEPDWSRPHALNFTDEHCRECVGCAHEWAMEWAQYDEPDEPDSCLTAPDDEDDGPQYPFLPVLTYGQAVAEMGDAFIITGPNVIPPPRTGQHYVRVYELARICGLPSHAVVALLRLHNEYALNHLSLIAKPAAHAFLTSVDIHGDLDALIATTRPLSIQQRVAQAIA